MAVRSKSTRRNTASVTSPLHEIRKYHALGFRVNAVVKWNKRAWHIAHVNRDATCILKRCGKAHIMKDDIPLKDLELIPRGYDLYKKWGPMEPVRTAEASLLFLTSTIEASNTDDRTLRKQLWVQNLKENEWLWTWIDRCYNTAVYDYGLERKHVESKKAQSLARAHRPHGIFTVLDGLGEKRWKPLKAAAHFLSMMESYDPYVHETCKMMLDRKFGRVSYRDMQRYMAAAGWKKKLP